MNTFLTGLNNETISEKLLAEEMNIVKGNGTGRVDGLENFVAVMFDADRKFHPQKGEIERE